MIYVGDVGTIIKLDVGVDISLATLVAMRVKKPNGTTETWNATLEGTRIVRHTIGTNELDIPGPYKIQAYVNMPGWQGVGEVVSFRVDNKI